MSIVTISGAPGAGAGYFAAVIARAEIASGAKVAWIGRNPDMSMLSGVCALFGTDIDGSDEFDLAVVDSGDESLIGAASLRAKRVVVISRGDGLPSRAVTCGLTRCVLGDATAT